MLGSKLLFYILTIVSVSAASLKGELDSSVFPLAPAELANTWLELRNLEDFGLTKAHLRQSGSFAFRDISQGIYELSIHSISIRSYENLRWRVGVSDDGSLEVFRVLPGHNILTDTGPKVDLSNFVLKPLLKSQYIFPREGFSLLGMIRSPMMLMSLAGLVFVFILPKMTSGLDPESLKELQQSQEKHGEMMDKVNKFDMASFIADKSKGHKKRD